MFVFDKHPKNCSKDKGKYLQLANNQLMGKEGSVSYLMEGAGRQGILVNSWLGGDSCPILQWLFGI